MFVCGLLHLCQGCVHEIGFRFDNKKWDFLDTSEISFAAPNWSPSVEFVGTQTLFSWGGAPGHP